MTTEHPITPPPELVQQWYDNMGPDPGPFESFAIAAADLFGDGGKVSNANFAALILRSVAETIYHDWDGWECVDHLNALANELHTPSESD